jgi:serine O-acetyltransferase
VLGQDLKRRKRLLELKGFWGTLCAVFSPGFIAVMVYRFGRVAMAAPLPVKLLLGPVYFVVFYLVQSFFGISVQAFAKIGPGFVILHRGCIFVVAEAIGANFTVSPGVTVGNVRGSKRLPSLGDDVFMEAGSKILGEVTIGDNVVLQANSLALKDVPSNSLAVGNPARVKPLPEQN